MKLNTFLIGAIVSVAVCSVALAFDGPQLTTTPIVPGRLAGTLNITLASVYPQLASLIPKDTTVQLWATTHGKPKAQVLAEITEENSWKNSLVLPHIFPDQWISSLPRICQTWLRNYILSGILFFGVSGAWAYYIYFSFGGQLFPDNTMPMTSAMLEQIKVSFRALPLYSAMPAVNEWLAEHGYLRAYGRVTDVGLLPYIGYLALYILLVEFGVYWMHRGLHEIKWAYKLIHWTHHKYNKENTLSPFAGFAFNPFDGMLQALPYTLVMLFVPMHFLTHELLLFFTAVWTTNIHDALHGNVPPIMGAGFHTIHHTTYKHNYGQFFTLMDALHGTLVHPEDFDAAKLQ